MKRERKKIFWASFLQIESEQAIMNFPCKYVNNFFPRILLWHFCWLYVILITFDFRYFCTIFPHAFWYLAFSSSMSSNKNIIIYTLIFNILLQYHHHHSPTMMLAAISHVNDKALLSVKWIFAFQNISIFHNLIYGFAISKKRYVCVCMFVEWARGLK